MSAPAGVWEQSLEHLAEEAATARTVAQALLGTHVYATAEIIRARVDERGGTSSERDTEVAGMIEALRTDLNAHLSRLAAKRPGS